MSTANVFNAATGQWVNAAAIANVTGGATVDAESRTATNSVLTALRNAGIIAGATSVNIGHTTTGALRVALGADITAPTGGATVDANARTGIGSVLTALRNAGIIAGGTAATHGFDATSRRITTAVAIADISAGATVDAETRTAANAALAAMRLRGLIAT